MSTRSKPLNETLLVIGATGKTGRRVVERLRARDLPVRAVSHSGTPSFDWANPGTWAPAIGGATSAYITYYPDLAVPGAAETVAAFAEVAVKQGLRRLVLLSGRGEPGAEQGELAVRASGAEWTILRSSWLSQNFSEGFFLDQVLAGEVALPDRGVPEPFVDADDLADVAVAALTDARHAGNIYELTGPRLLTFAEAVAEIARAAGRDIRHVPITLDEYVALMEAQAVPAEFVWLMRFLFTEVLDGRNARPADGVQRALGRAPRDFTGFARAAAASGVWAAPVALMR